MNRFHLSRAAEADIDDISDYLRSIPARPAPLRIGREIQQALNLIGQDPYLGRSNSRFTALYGQEVRSRLVNAYRIYYFSATPPEIIAILHGARDAETILRARLT